MKPSLMQVPVAADANMSLEEDAGDPWGTLGNIGIQGSSAGNALKRLLTLSCCRVGESFTRYSVSHTMDAAGNARPLVDVLGEVADATKNLGSAEKAAKFNEVFGLLGITSASAIGKSVTDTRALLSELQNAGGVAEKTAKEMDSGIGGAFRILKSSIEGVAIAIGESLSGPITRMVSGVLASRVGTDRMDRQQPPRSPDRRHRSRSNRRDRSRVVRSGDVRRNRQLCDRRAGQRFFRTRHGDHFHRWRDRGIVFPDRFGGRRGRSPRWLLPLCKRDRGEGGWLHRSGFPSSQERHIGSVRGNRQRFVSWRHHRRVPEFYGPISICSGPEASSI